MSGQPPDFLTIKEAARVLRIGRTKAYAMGQEWRVTKGASGIKVCEFGGQLRVPKAWLEEQLDAPVLFIPLPAQRTNANRHVAKPAPTPTANEPTPEAGPAPTPPGRSAQQRRRTKRSSPNTNQLSLPFS